jgi:hypothetical protein
VFVLGLVLGALFRLLLEQATDTLTYLRSWIAEHPWLDRSLRVLAWLFLLCLFAGGVYLLAFADYDADNSYVPTPLVRPFHFITAARHVKSLLGFLLGWFAFAYRRQLKDFGRDLRERIAPRGAPEPPPRARGAAESKPTGRSHAWLTSSVAIATVGAVVLVAIIIAQPDVFARLVSFKFGEVIEAKFVAAAEHSVRVNAPSFGGSLTARALLQRGTELPEVIPDIFVPTVNSLSAGLDQTERNTLITQDNHAFLFLQTFAVPLAQVVTCYLKEFPVGDTEVLHEAVTIADRWRRLATGEDDADKNFVQLAEASTALFAQIKEKVPKGVGFVTETYVPYRHVKAGCDLRTLNGSDPHQTLRDNIHDILKNGMVLSFISNLVAFTQNFETAATFLEGMDKPNDKGSGLTTGDPLGRFTFYATRVSAKYFARWYPPESIKSDFNYALSEVDAILAALSNPKNNSNALEDPRQYFEAERARLINNRLYYLLNETLQGRPLSPAETDEVRRLRWQLRKWVAAQPAALYETEASGTTGMVNKRRAGLVPPFYDTLATERIVVTQSAGKPTEQDCTQIRIYLDNAQDLYSILAKQTGSDNRDDFKIIDARRNMYESICGQNRRS